MTDDPDDEAKDKGFVSARQMNHVSNDSRAGSVKRASRKSSDGSPPPPHPPLPITKVVLDGSCQGPRLMEYIHSISRFMFSTMSLC